MLGHLNTDSIAYIKINWFHILYMAAVKNSHITNVQWVAVMLLMSPQTKRKRRV